jgi:hypothetical protein
MVLLLASVAVPPKVLLPLRFSRAPAVPPTPVPLSVTVSAVT